MDDSLLGVLEKMIPEKKITFAKMDFTNRRDQFSDLFHKKPILNKLSDFDSKEKRKEITRTLAEFITLRNYYTHGKLIIKYETDEYYIQYINKTTGIRTVCGIDRNILSSFLETGSELIKILSVIIQNL